MAEDIDKIEESYDLLQNVEPEDLVKYGFIPELVGRLPVLTSLQPLTDEAMLSILKEPKNSLVKQYKKMFTFEDGTELEFTDDALKEIVKKAKERKTGARALRSILENIMLKIMYELPDKENIERVIISFDTVVNNAEPEYVEKTQAKIA
jgi:ATP-dependent Clp protease ATP-binding subunit ClpX